MILFAVITLLYAILILTFVMGFRRVKSFNDINQVPQHSFSIIIPFRNEAENLPLLLKSIKQLDFPSPNFELIFVDDFSEDQSVEIIHSSLKASKCHYTIIENSRHFKSPKKGAITKAMNSTNFDWIITTDADCQLPRFWLNAVDSFITKTQKEMVVAPVTYLDTSSLLSKFQLLDFLSLQAITIGSFGLGKPILCNGANFAYRKDLFLKMDGFQGNENVSSGDDIFLLEKTLAFNKEAVGILKSRHAIVKTLPQKNIKDLIHQRLRWAAKTTAYKNRFSKFTAVVTLLMNIVIIWSVVAFCFGWIDLYLTLFVITTKFLVDAICILQAARFFNQSKVMTSYVLAAILYPIFVVGIGVGSLCFGFEWKNRTFRK